jgi:hypothetical protein
MLFLQIFNIAKVSDPTCADGERYLITSAEAKKCLYYQTMFLRGKLIARCPSLDELLRLYCDWRVEAVDVVVTKKQYATDDKTMLLDTFFESLY